MSEIRFLRLSGDKGGILVNGSAKHEKETCQNEYGDKHKPPKTMRRHKHIGLYTLDAYDNPGNTPQCGRNVIESVFIHKSGFICEIKQNFSIRNIPARTKHGRDIFMVGVWTAQLPGDAAEGIEISVQLKDVIRSRSYVLVGFVDGCQHVTIAGDFLFIAVTGFHFFLDYGLQAFVGCIDALDAVGLSIRYS